MAESLIVTAAAGVVKLKNGSLVYLDKGAEVPDGVDADNLKHLKDCGIIGSPKDVEGDPNLNDGVAAPLAGVEGVKPGPARRSS